MPGIRETSSVEFLYDLYKPLLEPYNPELAEKLYIGARGNLFRALQDGPFQDIWAQLAPRDSLKKWYESLQRILTHSPHNLSYTPALHNHPTSKKETLAGTTCFWIDVDGVIFDEWMSSEYPKLCGIPSFPLPHYAVNSGWGVHLYWLMRDFISFDNGEEGKAELFSFEKSARFFAWLLDADVQCSSMEHLLRFPGSINHKSSPGIQTKIYSLGTHPRYEKEEILTVTYKLMEVFLSNDYKCSETRKTQLRAIALGTSFSGRLTAPSQFASPEKLESFFDGKSTEAFREKLRKNQLECPFIDMINREKQGYQTLSYPMWISLGAALRRLFNDQNIGRELFLEISIPSNHSPDPVGQIQRTYDRLDILPWNCVKLPECACCHRLNAGKCKSILVCLARMLHSIETTERKDSYQAISG